MWASCALVHDTMQAANNVQQTLYHEYETAIERLVKIKGTVWKLDFLSLPGHLLPTPGPAYAKSQLFAAPMLYILAPLQVPCHYGPTTLSDLHASRGASLLCPSR